jgi:uncharacterized RDD family membrane protein YckC
MDEPLHYAGFWMRVLANLIDAVILAVLIVVLIVAFYGISNLNSATSDLEGTLGSVVQIGLAVVIVAFWRYWGGTPGKLLLSQRIIDARTGKAASTRQLIGRFFAYIVSAVPLGLGFLWVAFDPRKQGWHDKLAGTVVITDKKPKKA